MSSEELQTLFFQSNGMDKVLAADELVLRGEELYQAQGLLSRCIKGLTLKELQALDDGCLLLNFSVYLEVYEALQGQKRKSDHAWWIQKGEKQVKLHPRKLLHEDYHSAWKENWSNWKTKDEFIDWLIYRDIKEMAVRQEEVIIQRAPEKRSSSVVIGILSFVAVPYWTIMFFVALYYSFSSVLGPGLPLAFCAFMIVMSAPMGIGLLSGATWAHRMYITTGFLTILWFISQILSGHESWIWFGMLVYQVAVLMPIIAKEYGPFHIRRNSL